MDLTSTHLIQLIPPLVVLALLVIACLSFYRNYVLRSRGLCETLTRIGNAVRTMTDGDAYMRKVGVDKVFQGTPLEYLWRDFSKSLHAQQIGSGGTKKDRKYRLTVPVEYNFSASAVIDRPLGVEYFKHLPGILTGIGIIGTFSGLLFGLSSFDASTAETMSASIALLIAGVRDAFYASVAAITAAMVITHWEKRIYQRCLNALDQLVDALNNVFEAGVGEEYLASLVQQSNTSGQVAESIKDELLQAMIPILKQMEEIQAVQAQSVTEALEKALRISNRELASQFESAMMRQIKAPIEDMTQKLEGRLNTLRNNQQDLALKVIRARGQEPAVAGAVASTAASPEAL